MLRDVIYPRECLTNGRTITTAALSVTKLKYWLQMAVRFHTAVVDSLKIGFYRFQHFCPISSGAGGGLLNCYEFENILMFAWLGLVVPWLEHMLKITSLMWCNSVGLATAILAIRERIEHI